MPYRPELRLSPSEMAALHAWWLRHAVRLLDSQERLMLGRGAASAFYQAGLLAHRELFLAEMLTDFASTGAESDPIPESLKNGLLPAPDLEIVARVAWYYEVAIALAPDFAEANYNLATLRRRQGSLEQAAQFFRIAATSTPHPKARAGSFVNANSLWELACIETQKGNLGRAEDLFRKALVLLDNFGPQHRQFPDLLRRLGKHSEAAEHYDRISSYSHRYACEFMEPDFDETEKLPRHADGTSFDPAFPVKLPSEIGTVIYFAHLYFFMPFQAASEAFLQQSRAAAGDSFILRIKLLLTPAHRRMLCGPALGDLLSAGNRVDLPPV